MSKVVERKLTDEESRRLEELKAVGIGRASRERWALSHTGRALVGGTNAEMVLVEEGPGFTVLLRVTPVARAAATERSESEGRALSKIQQSLRVARASLKKAEQNRDAQRNADQVKAWQGHVDAHQKKVDDLVDQESADEKRLAAVAKSSAPKVEEWRWDYDDSGQLVGEGPYKAPTNPKKQARRAKREEQRKAAEAAAKERAERRERRRAERAERAGEDAQAVDGIRSALGLEPVAAKASDGKKDSGVKRQASSVKKTSRVKGQASGVKKTKATTKKVAAKK
jgi:colicin import membrane protein